MSLRGPTRLADTQQASQPLRQALHQARRQLPDRAHTRPLAERMRPWLNSPAGLGAVAASGSAGLWGLLQAAATSTLAKIGLGAVLGATVATVALQGPDAERERAVAPSRAPATESAATGATPQRAELDGIDRSEAGSQPSARDTTATAAAAAQRAAAPEPNAAEEPKPARTTGSAARAQQETRQRPRHRRRAAARSERSASVAAGPDSAPTGSDPTAELQLLRKAQDVLERDPDRALQLARRHARRFPDGLFVQEREVLAIEALLAKGRESPARQRTARFLAKHPDSTHAPRLRPLLRDEAGAGERAGGVAN